MPCHIVKKDGEIIGVRWGKTGKLYLIKDYIGPDCDRKCALKKCMKKCLAQAAAIFSSGYRGGG